MVETLIRLVDRLSEIDQTHPLETRKRALVELQQTFDARLVALISARHIDGRDVCSPATAVGDPELAELVGRCEGQGVGDDIDFRRPSNVPVNAFERIDHAGPLAEITGSETLEMREDTTCWHALLYDDQRAFVGWLFVCAPEQHLANTDGVAQALSDAMSEFSQLLSDADRDLSAVLEQSRLHCMFDHTGELEQTSECADDWLTPPIIDYCATTVRRLAATNVETHNTSVRGASVSFVRMIGDEASRYLMEADEAPRPHLAIDWQLTPRQREVAHLAADGMTAREVGEELGIAYNTVKKHLQNIYRKLEVASRLELAERLDE